MCAVCSGVQRGVQLRWEAASGPNGSLFSTVGSHDIGACTAGVQTVPQGMQAVGAAREALPGRIRHVHMFHVQSCAALTCSDMQ